jgi:hypothetical protein
MLVERDSARLVVTLRRCAATESGVLGQLAVARASLEGYPWQKRTSVTPAPLVPDAFGVDAAFML